MADYELLIKNGTIIDGLRMPAYHGDIGVRGGKIVAMGNVQESGKNQGRFWEQPHGKSLECC
jgi:N-acyl-D-aspartate/D-glutamate deacylase